MYVLRFGHRFDYRFIKNNYVQYLGCHGSVIVLLERNLINNLLQVSFLDCLAHDHVLPMT